MISGELDREIGIAKAVMDRLDRGDSLSSVLSQVRLLANMAGDAKMAALVDILTHGLTNVPYQPPPFTDPVYKVAGEQYISLCGVADPREVDMDALLGKALGEPGREGLPEKNMVVILSVWEMETSAPPKEPEPRMSRETTKLLLQAQRFFDATRSLLTRLRAYIYDYAGYLWLESTREKDRVALLGPDYRFVTDKLDTLASPLGNELLAVIDPLRSLNPAGWNLCALGCRNVVIKLGDLLWQVNEQTYVTTDGDEIDVRADKEKNRLYAYVDVHHKKVDTKKQELLKEARGLAALVYNKGSKGKKGVTHSEAQELVVKTFRLVALLEAVTGLEPIRQLAQE